MNTIDYLNEFGNRFGMKRVDDIDPNNIYTYIGMYAFENKAEGRKLQEYSEKFTVKVEYGSGAVSIEGEFTEASLSMEVSVGEIKANLLNNPTSLKSLHFLLATLNLPQEEIVDNERMFQFIDSAMGDNEFSTLSANIILYLFGYDDSFEYELEN